MLCVKKMQEPSFACLRYILPCDSHSQLFLTQVQGYTSVFWNGDKDERFDSPSGCFSFDLICKSVSSDVRVVVKELHCGKCGDGPGGGEEDVLPRHQDQLPDEDVDRSVDGH